MAKRRPFREFEDIEIVDMTHDGRGVARVEGKAVFVDGALTGERVHAKVVKTKRRFDLATTLAVHEPSPDRVAPRCAAFGVCGGCALQHQSDAAQREAKLEALRSAFEKIGRVMPLEWLDTLSASSWGYRRRARLGVKHVIKKGRVLVGFRERTAPYVADMNACEVLDPRVGHKLTELSAMIETLEIHARLPQIEVAVSDDVVALVLRVLDPPGEQDIEKLNAFASAHDMDIYLQPGGLDTVAPLTQVRPLRYALPAFELELEFEPIDFIQVHGELNRAMVTQAVDLLGPTSEDRVLDLFCGLGNFSLPLARRAGSVKGIEGDHGLTERARQNAERNGLSNTEFGVADLFAEPKDFGFVGETYDLALIDPPRTGAEAVLASVAATGVRRIVYVSCHPGTLARDAEALVHTHGFTLSKAGIMDMFPHTAHVESIAVFDREV
ncbi:MAG: 23S rRNA (uracil(1939)-C(5))-methyltransferase RlmD [Gammaproteobacteria bacterium]